MYYKNHFLQNSHDLKIKMFYRTDYKTPPKPYPVTNGFVFMNRLLFKTLYVEYLPYLSSYSFSKLEIKISAEKIIYILYILYVPVAIRGISFKNT